MLAVEATLEDTPLISYEPLPLEFRPPSRAHGTSHCRWQHDQGKVTVPGCREAPSTTACPGQITWLLANSGAVGRGHVSACCCLQLAHAMLGEVPGQHPC